MGILSTNKISNRSVIESGGTFDVTLNVTAAPNTETNPTDVVLVLDRSGSMRGSAIEKLKQAAVEFIDLLSNNGPTVLGQNRIGVISFANTAIVEMPLTQNTADLKAAVQSLIADGNTNTGDAFSQTQSMLSPSSANERIMVLFTDGEPTIGVSPTPIAQVMRQEGIEIYCIGYTGNGGLNEQLLIEWASSPKEKYVLIAPTEAEITEAFEFIAQEILRPGAKNVMIYETPMSQFEIYFVGLPSHGNATLMPDGTLQWYIPVLAAIQQETATLTFSLRDKGGYTGTMPINESIYLEDDEQQDPPFPSPMITIEGGDKPDCPPAIEVIAPPCVESIDADLGDIFVPNLGRMMRVSLTLKNLCPRHPVSVGILVSEVTPEGEISRGFKAMTVELPDERECEDMKLEHIHFVLPEKDGICKAQTFRVRAFVNAGAGTWGEDCLDNMTMRVI